MENKAACRQRKIFVLDNEERNEADAGRSLEKDGFFILNLSSAVQHSYSTSNCIGDEIRDKCQRFRGVIESSGRLFSQDENVATRINVRFYSNRLGGKIARQIWYRTFSKITSYFLVKSDFPILYRSFCSILRVSFLRSFHRYLCVFRRFILIIFNRCFYRFAAIARGARVNFYLLYSLISFVDFCENRFEGSCREARECPPPVVRVRRCVVVPRQLERRRIISRHRQKYHRKPFVSSL